MAITLTNPNDPGNTGVADWLRTDEHTASMSGYGNGKFGPTTSVTRAQIAQIFYRLLKDQNVKITVNFTDVAEDAWYAKAVNTLGSLGIVSGNGSGKVQSEPGNLPRRVLRDRYPLRKGSKLG